MKPFWMVFKQGGGPPTRQHDTEAQARAEAERLAITVGGKFYVLQAIASCERQMFVWDDGERPHGAGCECDARVPF